MYPDSKIPTTGQNSKMTMASLSPDMNLRDKHLYFDKLQAF